MTTSQATAPNQTPARPTEGAATTGASITDVYLTEQDLAARWHVNPGSLANARSAGRSPVPWTKPFGRVLYAVTDVQAAEAAGTVAA